ncbi:MAG: hypothetical protein WDZ45_12885 [Flavobacteriaceae bacterium]
MKTGIPQSIVRLLVCCVLFITSCGNLSNLPAQEKEVSQTAEFLIKIEATKSQIKLNCLSGCDWKELHYATTNANLLQAINKSGMTDLTEKEILVSDDSTDFIFTIEKTLDGLTLIGLEGTAWKNLSFTCPDGECIQMIDQMGMSKSK